MKQNSILHFIKNVLENVPSDWLRLTTHRLDIYEEKLAKTQFLEQLELLFKNNNATAKALSELPTAYDYIRLGHPLSCILEWFIANQNNIAAENVISFSSNTIPILAILRKNLIENKNTRIVYTDELPKSFDIEILKSIYGFKFELNKVEEIDEIIPFNGSTIFICPRTEIGKINLAPNIDFHITFEKSLGSIIAVNGKQNKNYISEIQHVRRRETIAMTPANCQTALQHLIEQSSFEINQNDRITNEKLVLDLISSVAGINSKALIASSGLSIQYAITMGLIHYAAEIHTGKAIKIVVPSNCYGGTNDQARRVAAFLDHVEIVDLLVDGENDMVQSIDTVLDEIASEDAIPFIIAEIPTNPRVEVPDLIKLNEALSKQRKTQNGEIAITPVFILDQTFCPNVHFLREEDTLKNIQTIAYISGSKFPSGGLVNAGFCLANKKAEVLMEKIEAHLLLCDNEATDLQLEVLANQMPSMQQRVNDAYKNTREFVNFIQSSLPAAKINFVSEELAQKGFTPSVFSLDLPTKGNTDEEREQYKRSLNNKLINLMITKIPNQSKHCVSYGQLKGCYWTVPATSTQGTTKEGDKDYIARVALSPDMDIELHKKIFLEFVEGI